MLNMTFNISEDTETVETIAARRQWAIERSQRVTEELALSVREAAANGQTEAQLVKRAGVARGTIRSWLGK